MILHSAESESEFSHQPFPLKIPYMYIKFSVKIVLYGKLQKVIKYLLKIKLDTSRID